MKVIDIKELRNNKDKKFILSLVDMLLEVKFGNPIEDNIVDETGNLKIVNKEFIPPEKILEKNIRLLLTSAPMLSIDVLKNIAANSMPREKADKIISAINKVLKVVHE